MTHEQLLEIALHAANGTAPANFTVNQVDAALVDGIKELAPSYNQFMKNRYDLYDIVIQTADAVLPKKTLERVGAFAEVVSVPQGQKALFKRKLGRKRAMQFLTQVGLSGVYETFRLDSETFEVSAHAVGGGASVDFERLLDGAESLAEVMSIITTGLTDEIYYEIQKALKAALNASARPAANKYTGNTYVSSEMQKLVNVAKAYGDSAIIYACPEFIAAMGPDAIVPAISGVAQGVYHPQDIDAIHSTGYVTMFRGTPIVKLENSFIDENNTKTWLDPQMAYVFPTGGEKAVKVVLEGDTQIRDFTNRDGSMEVFAYKKVGCAIQTHNNWCIYQNTGIAQTFESPYGF